MWDTINTTIQVASLYECDHVPLYATTANTYDPAWRQTIAGCKMLEILKDMYGFNVSYVIENLKTNVTKIEDLRRNSTPLNVPIDMYLRPMSLRLEHLDTMTPLHEAYYWRVGFILRHENKSSYNNFYRKPFTLPLWHCLCCMALLLSLFFYFLKRWEVGFVEGFECSYPYELLMVVGGFCQHIPPIEATLPSRRIAYLSFFLFAYTIYTYYTSNLLSHLVNDKDSGITLHILTGIDMEIVIADYMMLTISENIPITATHYNVIMERLNRLRSVTLQEGLDGVKAGKFALLSDYISVYPFVVKTFTAQEVCDISNVDIFSHVSKYFFVSKQLVYKEEFKIGLLRAKETGILKRLMEINQEVPECTEPPLVQAKMEQISVLIVNLLGTYAGSVVLLFIERAYYKYHKQNRLWPYME